MSNVYHCKFHLDYTTENGIYTRKLSVPPNTTITYTNPISTHSTTKYTMHTTTSTTPLTTTSSCNTPSTFTNHHWQVTTSLAPTHPDTTMLTTDHTNVLCSRDAKGDDTVPSSQPKYTNCPMTIRRPSTLRDFSDADLLQQSRGMFLKPGLELISLGAKQTENHGYEVRNQSPVAIDCLWGHLAN